MSAKKTDKSGLPIKIGATAKLEVRKSIKKSIKETVPEDVTRAKAGAWLEHDQADNAMGWLEGRCSRI